MTTFRPFIPILTLDIKQPDLASRLKASGYIFAIHLRDAGEETSRRNIELLIKGDKPFLIVLNPDECKGDQQCISETAELVELCLFSKNYFRVDNCPLITFIAPKNNASLTLSHQLSPDWLIPNLHSQGWPDIKKWEIFSNLSFRDQMLRKMTPPLVLDKIDVDAQFLLDNFFSNPDYLGNYIFFHNERTEQQFLKLCTMTIGNNPLWEVSFQEYMSIKSSVSELKKRNNMLQEMLTNAESTINLIKDTYKKDYHRLFKWYHKEYEVLPLWYKRFGHIIKVLMGQRSLRSLFNGRNKKYAGE